MVLWMQPILAIVAANADSDYSNTSTASSLILKQCANCCVEHTHLMVAYTTYAKALFPKGHGHPLWEPDPGEYAPVEIADVGYVSDGGL